MRNVLFVSLDTVRADVAYSGKMPGVESLRRRGVTFRQAVSSAPFTPASHASVFTGLQPARHGIRHLLREQLAPEATTLAERLKSAGYATGAVVSCPGLNKWYGMDRGFDHYDDEIPRLPDGSDPLTTPDVKKRGLALKRAPLVVERALEWLRHQDGPFFLFAHFFDAHWPYEPPEDFCPEAANPYEGEVAYSDHYLQVLLRGMEEMGHAPADTLIVCFSDHGEDLAGWYPNDHAGALGHPYEEGHGCLLFDATQHVPLVVGGPGLPAGVEVDAQVRLVDIAPTVLDLLGMDAGDVDGLSLTEFFRRGTDGASRPAYCETYYPEERRADGQYPDLAPLAAVRLQDDSSGSRKKVIWAIGADPVELYDLRSDPNEQRGQTVSSAVVPKP
ncbi:MULTISPECIES: sulfatase [unclassified Streptomyces]|uniref:sulfatase n=1 Tax=unclassified Streptomyces TaxID=2593676 RepID=UPI0005A73255|nr:MULTISPECIES: sulfatase [unclassified Streptomyces]ODA72688.1 Choline-sulfatase [Streptomyces sp. AVP053U2]